MVDKGCLLFGKQPLNIYVYLIISPCNDYWYYWYLLLQKANP